MPAKESVKHETDDSDQRMLSSLGENAKGSDTNQELSQKAESSNVKQESTNAGQNHMESISVVVNPHINEHGSRFYVKRRVIVGNVSKFIPLGRLHRKCPLQCLLPFFSPLRFADKRQSGLRQYTHKWMIYVTTPPGAEDISSFLSCVRYHLHPSYKPNDVIDVSKPPFHLTRLGWGEFPIRVQLHFADSRRNKVVDVFHQLKVLLFFPIYNQDSGSTLMNRLIVG